MSATDAVSQDRPFRTPIGRFFYSSETPYGMALARITLPLVLLVPVLRRWAWVRELYSTDGAIAPIGYGYGQPDLAPVFSGDVTVALYSALVFFLAASALGWMTRASLWATTILYTGFTLLDSMSTMTKYTVIASHALLILSLSPCGVVWSVDSLLRRRRRRARAGALPGPVLNSPERRPAWSRRLMQLMIGLVYFGAAFTKIHTPAYFQGDQLLTWMMSKTNHAQPLGEYLTLYPWLLVVGAYFFVVWELLFVFLVWTGWKRGLMLSLGVVFHLSTCLTLGLYIFPAVCFTVYFAFLEERDVQRIARFFRRLKRRVGSAPYGRRLRAEAHSVATGRRFAAQWARIPSPAMFLIAAIGATALGVEIEYRLDLYGLRRPEGRYQLTELDAAWVDDVLLAETHPIRLRDMFFSIDMGTATVGEMMFNSKDEYRQGDQMLAQVGMNLPHPDLFIECNVHDSEDRLIDRSSQAVTRESMRVNFFYNLTEAVEPGEYWLVVNTKGREVMRRRFTLLPAEGNEHKTAAAPRQVHAN